MISILNYGMGNLGSIQNMFKKINAPCKVITKPEEIDEAQALVIPGVGKFDNAMRQIESMGFLRSMEEAGLYRKIPVLGICLGMQLMTQRSEEGELPGLGWINAETCLIDGATQHLRVPHMGWDIVNIKKSSPYFDNSITEYRFYFVHSYAVHCLNSGDILTTTDYAGEFVSSFSVDNFLGVQFHPEKSHKFGAQFLSRFAMAHNLINS